MTSSIESAKPTPTSTFDSVGAFVVGIVGGVILAVIGVAVAVNGIPGADDFGNATGSTGMVIFGLALLGVGETISLIFVIATGVHIGVKDVNKVQTASS